MTTGKPESTEPMQEPPKRDTTFQPGQSGNPAGKPKGTRNATTLAVERLLEGEAEAITRAAINAAKDGDMVAIKLVLDRIAPPRKGRAVEITLPPVNTAQDVTDALGTVIAAVAAGDLTPDEAVTIGQILEVKRKAIETVDIEARIAALEGRNV